LRGPERFSKGAENTKGRQEGKVKGYINIDEERCKECKLCITTCPKSLIKTGKSFNVKGYYFATFKDKDEACTGCTLCAVVCPEVAIEVYRGK
jgi:2-oxoglutarate ferredoxin oxidoreductase subunit delta